MPLSRELALSAGELEELMTTSWNMRIATVGPAARLNVTPLWFAWVDGKVYAYCRGQKVANLRRNSTATVLVDRNEKFPELVGAMFQGTGEVLEDAAAEAADPALARAQERSRPSTAADTASRALTPHPARARAGAACAGSASRPSAW